VYEEEKDECAQESILGNKHKRNSVRSYSGEIKRSRMSYNFLHHKTNRN